MYTRRRAGIRCDIEKRSDQNIRAGVRKTRQHPRSSRYVLYEDEAEFVLRVALAFLVGRRHHPLSVAAGHGDGGPTRLLPVQAVAAAVAAEFALHRQRLAFDAGDGSLDQLLRPLADGGDAAGRTRFGQLKSSAVSVETRMFKEINSVIYSILW